MPKSHNHRLSVRNAGLEPFAEDFFRVLGVEATIANETLRASAALLNVAASAAASDAEYRRLLLRQVACRKLDLARPIATTILNEIAKRKVYPNQLEKDELRAAIDTLDPCNVIQWLEAFGLDDFVSLGEMESLDIPGAFAEQFRRPQVKRSDARRNVDHELRAGVLNSLFSGWIYRCCDKRRADEFFNENARDRYFPEYFEHVMEFHPRSFARENALAIIRPSVPLDGGAFSRPLIARIFETIRAASSKLSNHCVLAVELKSERLPPGRLWDIALETTLFAEKYNGIRLRGGFFNPDQIARTTQNQIPTLDVTAADFTLAHLGLYYRDCLVIERTSCKVNAGGAKALSLVLLFEKNAPDEAPIPCPACRSLNVRGNSYPTLGVRSWECANLMCPDRSLFNRGNRFSAISVIRQRAIANPADQIPAESIKRWRLDYVKDISDDDALDMLIRHYSFAGDTVLIYGDDSGGSQERIGRTIDVRPLIAPDSTACPIEKFNGSPYFRRFLAPSRSLERVQPRRLPTFDGLHVYNGDCRCVTEWLPAESFDGAVTSPPYYNAREYSQWSNLYGYLYDMKMAAESVLTLLKPGGYFLFNIFDYFDNDRTIAQSDMGKRRLTLSAHLGHIFKRCGFDLCGNVVWFKGHIEGKRNFNNGNRSPYYQRPHNAWEHILIFRKPGHSVETIDFPAVLDAKPVIKIVAGTNIYGHSAPFPREVPDLLCSRLPRRSHILDPFAGSMTTAESALSFGHSATMIEFHEHFCELGIKRLRSKFATPSLFGAPGL